MIFDMNRALPLAKNAQRPDRLPLRVLAGGLRLEATMPGKTSCLGPLDFSALSKPSCLIQGRIDASPTPVTASKH